ncbi:MAG: glycosyltransferase family 2 protein [Cyclobacteriaceae bacterium]
MAEIAVVILNYNGQTFLENFLPGVIANSPEARIYIADNASDDGSIDYVTKYHHQVNIIQLEENHGFAGGYNHALKQVEADYFVLLNSDIEVTPNWISPVIDWMEAHEDCAACQPKILDYNKKSTFEYAGAAGGYIDNLGYPYCRGRVFETLEEDKGQYDTTKQIFWASGACMFVRSYAFFQSGGFDEDFFAHMEEIDLCWRLNLSGQSIYCVPESKVYHVGGGTLSKTNPNKTYLNFRNSISMLYKNTESTPLLWKLPLKFMLDLSAGFKFLLSGSVAHFSAVWKAYFHFIRDISKYSKKRYQLSRIIKKEPTQSLDSFILPVQYFLLGKKKYHELKQSA